MSPLFWNSGNVLLWLTIPLIPIHPCCCFPYNYIRMSSLEINPNYSFSQSKALSPISLFCMALVAQSRWEVVYPAVKGHTNTGILSSVTCPISQSWDHTWTKPHRCFLHIWIFTTETLNRNSTEIMEDCGTCGNKAMWCNKRKGWIRVEKSAFLQKFHSLSLPKWKDELTTKIKEETVEESLPQRMILKGKKNST